jgi:hypothetical protein
MLFARPVLAFRHTRAGLIQPGRSIDGASGNRIRLGSGVCHQWRRSSGPGGGVQRVNEQLLLGRLQAGEIKSGRIFLLEK